MAEEETLLSFLEKKYPESSKTTLRKMINEGRVLIGGIVARSAQDLVSDPARVKILSKRDYLEGDVKLLYRDNDIAVVEKPPGLLSVATDNKSKETLHGILKKHFSKARVYPVHRLDQDTSGLLVFALNEKARDVLKKEFEKREPKRRYVAVVEGNIEDDKGIWRSYLTEGGHFTVRETDNEEEGKLAVTHYKVALRGNKTTLIELKLETGRKNQIRVHCQAAGVSVVGDKKYGAKTNPFRRLMLHAFELTITHPTTGKKMVFESIVPEEFYRL